ncbi:hypothetical protein EVAR_49777_1 [Eumeta japonica]|uniref:Uncharacterized protein n=1 Tax=Eumeta variegata TaxID=151549 RepID=A0A4C1Y2E7_EUMVA|nr:hypothetical protein EVAR_49777_1 [Eumeta japonica]
MFEFTEKHLRVLTPNHFDVQVIPNTGGCTQCTTFLNVATPFTTHKAHRASSEPGVIRICSRGPYKSAVALGPPARGCDAPHYPGPSTVTNCEKFLSSPVVHGPPALR